MGIATVYKFRRKIGIVDATAIVIGSMIGSGIFIVSSDIARSLGSPGWLLVVWLISGFLTVIAALSYGELASMIPNAGGQYVYLRKIFNPLTGFLYGWSFLLVVQGGSIAAVGMAFGKFSGVIFPGISDGTILMQLGSFKISSVHAVAIISIIFLTWINTRGITAGKTVQNLFTVIKVGILVLFILIGIFFARNMEAIHANLKNFWHASQYAHGASVLLGGWALIACIGTSMVGALFSLDAWNNITFAAGEVKNPKKTIPLSLFYGTLIVAVLYFFTNVVYLMALPLNGSPEGVSVIERGIRFTVDDRIGTASMEGILGSYAALVMAILVVISTFGCNNGMILSGARVYYAMAHDKVFFRGAGILNKHGVPARGLVFQCIWAIALCLSGTYSDLLDYVIFAVLIFFTLTIISIFVLRVKRPDIPRPYKAFGYPVIPALYVVTTVTIMVILLMFKPKYTFPGLIIVLIGIPVYFLWRKYSGRQNEIPIADEDA